MKNVLIIDDNRSMCDELAELLGEIAGGDVRIAIRTGGNSALIDMELDKLNPDVVFMDIKLGKLNGIDVAEEMLKLRPSLQVVFISGYDDYYLDVYKVRHVYFIRKPFSRDSLQAAWKTLMQRQTDDVCSEFAFKTGGCYMRVRCSDILYFEMEGRKVNLYTTKGSYSFYGTVREIMENLRGGSFVQCHKGYIINLQAVKEYHADRSVMTDERAVPISRTYKETVKERFMEYIGA